MHTKEKLKISDIKADVGLWGPILQAEGGRIIAWLARHPGQHPKEEAFAQEQADAERLAACWNALVGLNPDAIKGLVKAAEAVCQAVRMAPTDRVSAGIDEDLAIRTQYFMAQVDALSALLAKIKEG